MDWYEAAKKRSEEKDKAIQKMKDILSENNIEMNVGGCGCCDSPWVRFSYQGEVIVDEDSCSFDNTKE